MLVLSRKVGETLLALPPGQPPIEVVVHRISGNRVTIGVKADKQTRLVRGELLPRPEQAGEGA